ncbi:hypothetical protein NPIL_62181 [Nephila pilipes]|uniref:Uncharacterized protein n=1 Tax=Nephila pilipes TaxID=299642 RepID=A0A8X6UC78_NEPPI|nr:hypothetical protein NPIL_62181 [Nephila pilipes]
MWERARPLKVMFNGSQKPFKYFAECLFSVIRWRWCGFVLNCALVLVNMLYFFSCETTIQARQIEILKAFLRNPWKQGPKEPVKSINSKQLQHLHVIYLRK